MESPENPAQSLRGDRYTFPAFGWVAAVFCSYPMLIYTTRQSEVAGSAMGSHRQEMGAGLNAGQQAVC